MCRLRTPESQQVPCSRCGEVANPTDGWEHDWPLYGRIELGCPSQMIAKLCGARLALERHFAAGDKGHPAMTRKKAQDATFEWGNGYRFDSRGRYRLCYECQCTLIGVIGEFFGFPQEPKP